MAYLNSPRLTFSGQFQADPSTVNNDPNHFNNETFQSSYQDYQTPNNANGWWNPDGTGNWRFLGCTITSVTYKDGTSTSDPIIDPIIGMSVSDSESRVSGKIVDLDSQQQMVSELWGFIVRIVADGKEVMKGDYETAAFTNIWFNRSTDLSRDAAAGATYQSIIRNINWDIENLNSRYLAELKETSAEQLSIQFTVDRYNGDYQSSQFTLGRIVGSIGPSSIEEPVHFVLGRQLFPVANSNCNYALAIVNENLKTLVLDFANALQFGAGGVVVETRNLKLAIDKGSNGNSDYVYLGEINYDDPAWYAGTSGIITFQLSDENLELVTNFPLAVVYSQSNQTDIFSLAAITTTTAVLQESAEYVCADKYVFRLNPNEACTVDFYATNLGKPLVKAINLQLDTANILQAPDNPILGVPDILAFSASVIPNSNGKASVTINAANPGNPRQFIDGQVYAISYNLIDQDFANCNQLNFLSLLVYSGLDEASINNPVWETDILPIMQQYANLYPLMSKGIFNLAKKEVVDGNAEILKFVFGKAIEDPNYMPVTRDLSGDKQKMIFSYLDGVLKSATSEKVNQSIY